MGLRFTAIPGLLGKSAAGLVLGRWRGKRVNGLREKLERERDYGNFH